MCDPLSVTAAAVSIGGVIAGADAQNKQDAANKKSSAAALKVANRDISIRALQERIAATQEAQALNLQAADASAQTQTSAAAGNVGGMTVDLLLQDLNAQRLTGLQRITDQKEDILAGLDRERSGALATSRNRNAQTAGANPLATGLRIAGAGLDLAAQRRSLRPPVIPGKE